MPSDEAVLVEQLVRLGVDDPQGTARSEIAEDIPQVAYARLERLVRVNLMSRRQTMDIWWANLQRERDRRPESRPAVVAKVIGKCLAAGVTLEELGVIVEDVAQETAHGFAYLLGDPHDDELGDPSDLPSWALVEVSSKDDGAELTGRTLDALHEFLGQAE